MKTLIFIFLLLISCTSKNSNKEILPLNFVGKVVGIKDGDTFKIMYLGEEKTIRLEHIDCPEKNQPFGKRAKQFASDLCFGRMARVTSEGKMDRYKRLIAEVYVDNICVNKELVKSGLAWHFKKYSDSQEYAEIEINARRNQIGIWSDNQPIAPWDWRKK